LYNTETFLHILNAPAFKTFFPKLDEEDMLQRIPTGFPTDFQHGHLLRHKHYTVSTPLADEIVVSDTLIPDVIKRFRAIKPFNAFLNLS